MRQRAQNRRDNNAVIMRDDQMNREVANNMLYHDANVNEHSCGEMNVLCNHCRAKNFMSKKPADGLFKNSCHRGKVLPPIRRDFPPYLKSIMSDPQHPHYTNFKENIRSYNSALSFASMGAQIADSHGRGPYCFRVHGQIHHNTSHAHPVEGEQRQYAQLYVVDSAEANAVQGENQANTRCIQEVMHNLDLIITEMNVYAASSKALREIEIEKEVNARNEARPPPAINLNFTITRNSDRGRYNLPAANEIAIAFRNEEGEPPFDRDFKAYPKNDD